MTIRTTYKFIFLLLVSVLLCKQANAQVTVGSDVPALSFITLQIDGVSGGMRFPLIDNATDKTVLTNAVIAAGEKGGGLIIFNAESGQNWLEYWDAVNQEWIKMNESVFGATGRNGISGINALSLGGDLIRETSVDLNTRDLLFRTTSAAGQLAIQDDALVVKNNMVGVGTTAPANAKLFIAVDDSLNTTSTKRFRYDDGSGSIAKYKVLTSDEQGYASWTNLKNPVEIKSGTFLNATQLPNNSNTLTAISNSMTLTRGRWLIIARITTTGSTITTGQYLWLRLFGNNTNSAVPTASSASYQWTGARPQTYSSGWATPQTYEIIDVTTNTYYVRLYMSTSSGTPTTQPTYHGGAYFYAIKLSDL